MLELEILIGKGARAIDAGRASSVAIEKVTTLNHKVFDLVHEMISRRRGARRRRTYDTMELAALEALGPAKTILGLAGTELAKVFSRPRNDVFE